MAVHYSLALMSSKPNDKNAPKLYYAKAQANGEVSMDEMAEDIAYATSLTDGDVINVIRALIRQLNVQLAAGKIVRMENLGTFQLQLRSKGAESEAAFTVANIEEARIQFRPGKTIKAATRAIDGLTFKRVAKLSEPLSDENTGSTSGGDNDDDTQLEDPLG